MNDSVEQNLLITLRNIMEDDSIKVEDDFFSIGGDSKKAMQLLAALKEQKIYISIADFFKCKNIRDIAKSCQFKEVNKRAIIDSIVSSVDDREIIYNKEYDMELTNLNINYQKKKYQSVLLTGATGYLGSHIAEKIIKNTDLELYVLIRGKNEDVCKERLFEIWKQYDILDNKEEVVQRVKIVVGDISQDKLGLKAVQYNHLAEKINVIIHAAAVVSHVEKWEKYRSINIVGTQNIMKFSLYLKKKDINYISTIATEITEDRLENMYAFEEKSLADVKSEILYVQSKIICERMLEEHRKKGCNVKIFRMGFLVQNYSNGKFQVNAAENGLFNVLSLLNQMGVFPIIKNPIIDLTYVDEAAEAVVKLVGIEHDQYIYHIVNNKIKLDDIAYGLKKYNEKIKVIDLAAYRKFLYENADEFWESIERMSLILMLDAKINLNIFSVSRNEKTMKLLKALDFEWSQADNKAMKDIYKIITQM